VKEFADFLNAHGGKREAVTDASIDMGRIDAVSHGGCFQGCRGGY
jgi:hypothetical protein